MYLRAEALTYCSTLKQQVLKFIQSKVPQKNGNITKS